MPPGFPTAHSPTPRTRSTRGLRLRPETAAPPAPLPYGAAGGAAHLAAASSAAAPAAICCSRSEGAALLPIAAACSVATGPGRSQSGKIPRRHQRRLPPAPRPGRRPHADRRDLGGERAPWKPGHGGGRFSLCFSGSGRGTSPPRFTRAAGGSPPPGSLRPLIPPSPAASADPQPRHSTAAPGQRQQRRSLPSLPVDFSRGAASPKPCPQDPATHIAERRRLPQNFAARLSSARFGSAQQAAQPYLARSRRAMGAPGGACRRHGRSRGRGGGAGEQPPPARPPSCLRRAGRLCLPPPLPPALRCGCRQREGGESRGGGREGRRRLPSRSRRHGGRCSPGALMPAGCRSPPGRDARGSPRRFRGRCAGGSRGAPALAPMPSRLLCRS